MCVDGSFPTALGCTSGFLPNYGFGSSYGTPWYGNNFAAPGFNYGMTAKLLPVWSGELLRYERLRRVIREHRSLPA